MSFINKGNIIKITIIEKALKKLRRKSFIGLCIKKKNSAKTNSTVTMRSSIKKENVFFTFLLDSPIIKNIRKGV